MKYIAKIVQTHEVIDIVKEIKTRVEEQFQMEVSTEKRVPGESARVTEWDITLHSPVIPGYAQGIPIARTSVLVERLDHPDILREHGKQSAIVALRIREGAFSLPEASRSLDGIARVIENNLYS